MAGDAAPTAAAPPPRPPPAAPVVAETISHDRYLTVWQRDIRLPASHGREVGGGRGDGGGAGRAASRGRLAETPSFRPSPQAETVSYDVVGHPRTACTFVTVFPFHAATKEVGRRGRRARRRARDAPPPRSRPPPPPNHSQVTLVREFAQGPNAWLFTLPAGGFDPAKHASLAAAAAAELSEEARLTGGAWTSLLSDPAGAPEVKWCANRYHAFLCIDPTPDAAPGPRDAEERIDIVRVGVGRLKELVRQGALLPPSAVTAWLALDELAARGLL